MKYLIEIPDPEIETKIQQYMAREYDTTGTMEELLENALLIAFGDMKWADGIKVSRS